MASGKKKEKCSHITSVECDHQKGQGCAACPTYRTLLETGMLVMEQRVFHVFTQANLPGIPPPAQPHGFWPY